MLFKCRKCKGSKERKEFHYKNFETSIPRKLCWDCEIRDAKAKERRIINEEVIKGLKITISDLQTKLDKQIQLTNGVQKISFSESMVKMGELMKHRNLNVYMRKGDNENAFFKMKGKFRKYKPVQSKFGPEMCIIVKPSYGGKKWYELNRMYKWIMEEGKEVESL